jgi:hypothetical protein
MVLSLFLHVSRLENGLCLEENRGYESSASLR